MNAQHRIITEQGTTDFDGLRAMQGFMMKIIYERDISKPFPRRALINL
jgi:hypothetical protein